MEMVSKQVPLVQGEIAGDHLLSILCTLKITLSFKNYFKAKVFNKLYYCPHFTDEEAEAQKGQLGRNNFDANIQNFCK